MTASEIQEELGKELTEAAVLRALHELWASLRVVPLYQTDGQETLWEPLQSRHQKAITSGVGMSQVTALSVLASVYLQSVVAASGDDAESFLSPLASRSKVREVIRGLTATRQLSLIQMETQSLLYVEGSLPEFPEAEKPVPIASEPDAKPAIRRPHPTSPQAMEAALRRSVAGSARSAAYKRPAAAPSGGFEKRRAVLRKELAERAFVQRRALAPILANAKAAAIVRLPAALGRSSPELAGRKTCATLRAGHRIAGRRHAEEDPLERPARRTPRPEGQAGKIWPTEDRRRWRTPVFAPCYRREPGSFRPATGSRPAFDRNRPAAGRSVPLGPRSVPREDGPRLVVRGRHLAFRCSAFRTPS